MNSLVIPPSPNWYQSSILACSPDNTVIYGSRNDLVVVTPPPDEKSAADIKLVRNVHNQKVLSVSLNKNWGNPDKYCATATSDNYICLWNMITFKKTYHNSHGKANERVVGACFAGDEKIVSVAENGRIVIWHIGTNEETDIKDIFGSKVTIQCLSICPHATWLAAFGMKNGLLCLVDLRKGGKLLHKLRGHDKQVQSLSWCPAPVNVFPKSPNNTVKNKTDVEGKELTESAVEVLEAELEALEIGKEDADKQPEPQSKAATSELHISSPEPKTTDGSWILVEGGKSESEAGKGEIKNDSTTSEQKEKEESNTSAADESKGEKDASSEQKDTSADTTQSEVDTENTGVESHDGENEEKDASSEAVLSEADTENTVVESVEAEEKNFQRHVVESQVEEPRKEFLLASAGKDNNIYIWRAGTDGRMQTFLSVPQGPKTGKYRSYDDKFWITINWISPNCLLSSSKGGVLLKWTLPRPLNSPMSKPTMVHKDHSGIIFSIAGPTKIYSGMTWDNPADMCVWTAGHDRRLICCRIDESRKNLASYQTLGGHPLCMAVSDITPSRLAFGLNDGTIKVWELGQPHTVQIEMTTLAQKIQDKVSTLAWHPHNEFHLAFGTSEGRIGVFDTSNPSKPPRLVKPYFRSQIHKLEWGPYGATGLDAAALYALGEGRIMTYYNTNSNDEPVEVVLPYKMYAYHFAWKQDYTTLLVSVKSGELLIYGMDLKIYQTLYLRQKGFTNILWHPYCGDSTNEENYHLTCWFAATMVGDSNVYLYNLSRLMEAGEECTGKADAVFSGHDNTVTCLAWDYFRGDRLVSAGEDGIVQVWNTVTGEIMSTYVEQGFETITSIMWSPLNEDHIIIGSKCNSVVIWKVSDHPPQKTEDLFEKRKAFVSQFKTAARPPSPVRAKSHSKSAKSRKLKAHSILSLLSNAHHDPEKHCSEMRRLIQWKESTKDGDKSEEKAIERTHDTDFLQLFGSNEQMFQALTMNEEFNKERGKKDLALSAALWKGELADCIKDAIEHKAVTPRMLALAPMVSTKLWQDACGTFAEQLSEWRDSDPMDTAMYFLACHRVDDALESLCESNMYKEALALAKCRKPENDPCISDIVRKWGQHAFSQGDFETATECHIFLGEYEDAAKVLSKRTDCTLEVARELAELCGNRELEKSIRVRLVAENKEKESNEKKQQNEQTPTLAVLLINKEMNGDANHFQLDSDSSPEKADSGIDGQDVNSSEASSPVRMEAESTDGKAVEASDSSEKIEAEDEIEVEASTENGDSSGSSVTKNDTDSSFQDAVEEVVDTKVSSCKKKIDVENKADDVVSSES